MAAGLFDQHSVSIVWDENARIGLMKDEMKRGQISFAASSQIGTSTIQPTVNRPLFMLPHNAYCSPAAVKTVNRHKVPVPDNAHKVFSKVG